ncbi:hypothetical protein AOR13_2774 [Alteromonas stellipolaris LMG 21856]|nr:hypothetical protein AOR13_2774 [Alteromonas stellipolaris LMG 21856]
MFFTDKKGKVLTFPFSFKADYLSQSNLTKLNQTKYSVWCYTLN